MKSSKEWISISDMMTGLMMIFLFISVLYMDQIQKKVEDAKKISQQYVIKKESIIKKLKEEFKEDFEKWDAKIIEEFLIIRFLSPDVMFKKENSLIKDKFKVILNDFCPRYFQTLYEFKEGIEEIRIEGHTSSEWTGASEKEAYFNNMKLSQDRTRSVLQYCTTIKNLDKDLYDWTIKKITANGLSSSRPVPECESIDTFRCRDLNRRVEFRIQVNESDVLYDIIKKFKNIAHQDSQDQKRNISSR